MQQLVPDDELIEQIRFKNDYALDLLLQRYRGFIYSWINKVAPIINADLLEDLFQVGNLTLFECLYSYNPRKGNFFSYFKICAVMKIKNAYQEYLQYKKYNVVNDEAFRFIADNSSFYGSPSDDSIQQEEVLSCLENSKKITDKERAIFKMRMQGFSYQEIAKKLQIDVRRVDNTLQKIKKILIGILQ